MIGVCDDLTELAHDIISFNLILAADWSIAVGYWIVFHCFSLVVNVRVGISVLSALSKNFKKNKKNNIFFFFKSKKKIKKKIETAGFSQIPGRIPFLQGG